MSQTKTQPSKSGLPFAGNTNLDFIAMFHPGLPKLKNKGYDLETSLKAAIKWTIGYDNNHPEWVMSVLGEEAYNHYRMLMDDKSPGLPAELLRYVAEERLYSSIRIFKS